MGKKVIWLVVSCLMVASLVLASCAPAVIEEEEVVKKEEVKKEEVKEEVVKEEVAPEPEGPKYGGVYVACHEESIVGFDETRATASRAYSLHLTQEAPQVGDWAKGPAGTGEASWLIDSIYSGKIETGALAESWDIPDNETIIFHIRKGVYWHNKPPVNGRELTAADVAFSFNYNFGIDRHYVTRAHGGWWLEAEATDKYTVVIRGKESQIYRTAAVWDYVADWIYVIPPESYEGGKDQGDWRDALGTGPFMLTDFVPDSALTFVRNPNYWMKDPVGPGKGNQLPYLDGVKILIIKDASTRLAALRTGKIDNLLALFWEDSEILINANPDLQYVKYLKPNATNIYMRMDKGLPFDDIKVRRALQIAIDRQAIADEYFNGGEVLAWPIAPYPEFEAMYTPIDKLPESTRELYEYNTDKAKQLLAEAGYPDGFATEVVCYSADVDLLSIVADYWTKIGVDLKLDVKERAVWYSYYSLSQHEQMLCYTKTLGGPLKMTEVKPGSVVNLSKVDDPYINERYGGIWAYENIGNEPERERLMKECALRMLDQAWICSMPVGYVYNIWWPWLKNYHGESAIGYFNRFNYATWMWIDQDLKEELTGKR
ncbi:ABC transporter substrate-binding protein [Chloroflexota bacterium]